MSLAVQLPFLNPLGINQKVDLEGVDKFFVQETSVSEVRCVCVCVYKYMSIFVSRMYACAGGDLKVATEGGYLLDSSLTAFHLLHCDRVSHINPDH